MSPLSECRAKRIIPIAFDAIGCLWHARFPLLFSLIQHGNRHLAVASLALLFGCGAKVEAPAAADISVHGAQAVSTKPGSGPRYAQTPTTVSSTPSVEVGTPEISLRPGIFNLYSTLTVKLQATRRASVLPPSWCSTRLRCEHDERVIAQVAGPFRLSALQTRTVGEALQSRVTFSVPRDASALSCELAMFVMTYDGVRERIGNWCLNLRDRTAASCAPAVTPAPSGASAPRFASFEMVSKKRSDGPWRLSYRGEYVVGQRKSLNNSLYLVASCDTASGRRADVHFLEQAPGRALTPSPTDTRLFHGFMFSWWVLDASLSQCEVRVVESDDAWSSASTVVDRQCWREGTASPGACSGASPKSAERSELKPSSLKLTPSLQLDEDDLELLVDVTVVHAVTHARVWADVRCVDQETREASTRVWHPYVRLLEPGETLRMSQGLWRREKFSAIPRDCTVTLSAAAKPHPWGTPEKNERPTDMVPLGTTCLHNGIVVACE